MRTAPFVVIFICILMLIILGYGGNTARGFSYGMGREAAHAVWHR